MMDKELRDRIRNYINKKEELPAAGTKGGAGKQGQAQVQGKDRGPEDAAAIAKRLNNLFWTVSGDYALEARLNTASFRRSPWISLYDSIRQGSFARYFDRETLEQFLQKKVLGGAEATVLYPIAWMCTDSAVHRKAAAERSGVPQIRQKAFAEILEKEAGRLSHTDWGRLEECYLRFCLYGTRAEEEKQRYVDRLCSIADASEAAEVLRCIDEVYEQAYEKGFADWFKGLNQLMTNDGRAKDNFSEKGEGDEEEERTADLFTEQLHKEEGERNTDRPNQIIVEDEAMERMVSYVELNYGRSYLSREDQRRLDERLCTGSHAGCHLHFTDGILHSGTPEGPKSEFDRKVREENYGVFRENELVARQNIRSLADVLRRGLFARQEKEVFLSEYGDICVERLWNVGRTENRKLFTRRYIQDTTDFVVEVLIDASGSQQVRQSMVALQGYIISSALTAAGIAHRVMGFCTFGDYTVMRRFRDYGEGPEADERLFEFYGSSNNRDGLAIRASADSLASRPEENKILIVLSDGTPNDIIVSKMRSRRQKPYAEENAVRDTAAEVYGLRNRGITVLGIFAGGEEALKDERRMFGNEFVYIRDIAEFSNVVGRYLKEQIMDR